MNRKQEIAKEISQTLPTFLRHMFPYVFQPIKLPPSQVIALVSIQERRDCTLTELRKEMHVSAPTITGIVSRLERDGYVKRLPDDKDRRIVHVVLTPKGVSVGALDVRVREGSGVCGAPTGQGWPWWAKALTYVGVAGAGYAVGRLTP